jgi:hypothetical protein
MTKFNLPRVVLADASILACAEELKEALVTQEEARQNGDTELFECVAECVVSSVNKRLRACLSDTAYFATIDWAFEKSGFMA